MSLLTLDPSTSQTHPFLPRIAGILLLILLGFSLLACAPTRPAIETANWLVAPERTGATRTMQSPLWLKMGSFNVTTPFDSKSLVYRLGDQQYEKDLYDARDED